MFKFMKPGYSALRVYSEGCIHESGFAVQTPVCVLPQVSYTIDVASNKCLPKTVIDPGGNCTDLTSKGIFRECIHESGLAIQTQVCFL
jgi:hypothetical protein